MVHQLHVLEKYGSENEFLLELDPASIEQMLLAGDEARHIAPVNIRHDPAITPITPYEHSTYINQFLHFNLQKILLYCNC